MPQDENSAINDLLPLHEEGVQRPPDDLIITEDETTTQTPETSPENQEGAIQTNLHLVTRKETRNLFVQFDEETLATMSNNLAAQTMEIVELKEAKKNANANYNHEIKQVQEHCETLAEDIMHKGKDLDVAVEITFNSPEIGKKTILRTDTFDKWEEDMTPADHRLDNLPHEQAANVNDGSNDEDEEDPDPELLKLLEQDPLAPPFGPDTTETAGAPPTKEEIDEEISAHELALNEYLRKIENYRQEKYQNNPDKLTLGLNQDVFSEAMDNGQDPAEAFDEYLALFDLAANINLDADKGLHD